MTAVLPNVTANCPHCGMVHQQTCPRIKAIEYHDNGTVKRVEFHNPIPLPLPPKHWAPVPMPNIGEGGVLVCPPITATLWQYGRN